MTSDVDRSSTIASGVRRFPGNHEQKGVGAAILENRLDSVDHERKPGGLQDRPLAVGIEAAPELWCAEPIVFVVNLVVAHPEVGEQDTAGAEPPCERAEQPGVFGARDVDQRIRRDRRVEAGRREFECSDIAVDEVRRRSAFRASSIWRVEMSTPVTS